MGGWFIIGFVIFAFTVLCLAASDAGEEEKKIRQVGASVYCKQNGEGEVLGVTESGRFVNVKFKQLQFETMAKVNELRLIE
jgi:hypothetical protein